ncbi:MAG: cardiolipin synthase [Christensenella sp.]|nr:cardiolipin synthase [Christensenella sp.]
MKKIFSFLASRMFIVFALIAVQAWIFISIMYGLDAYKEINIMMTVVAILLVLWITSKPENPAYKIGWIIVVLLLPVLGILLYFFFSQRKLNKKSREAAQRIYEKTRSYLRPLEQTEKDIAAQSGGAARQSRYITASSMYPLYEHTSTKYYPMGEDFYEDLLVDLEKAEKYIFMEYFIVEEGKMWDSILEILEKKVAQGLDVRFLYDDIGCIHTLPDKYYKQLRAKGIQCEVFNPLRPILNSMFNNRDHRKITVIDGHTAYCGGANLADEYINAVNRFGVWKDAAVRLHGTAAWSFLVMFLQTWEFTSKQPVDYEKLIPERDAFEELPNEGFVQPFGDNPLDDIYVSQNVYLGMISNAKDYLYINTPYLILGYEMMTALATAAQSGVDVRITVPHIPDKKMVFLLTKSYYAQLVRAGVKVYEYTPGFIHSKTFVSDDRYAVVGTINLDFRSLYLHYECGVWMYRTPCVPDLKRDYLETVQQSNEITMKDVESIPWYTRFAQTVLRIFGPMM